MRQTSYRNQIQAISFNGLTQTIDLRKEEFKVDANPLRQSVLKKEQENLKIDDWVEVAMGENQGYRKGDKVESNIPDDSIGAFADRHDGRLVLGCDLKDVAEDVVLDESAAVTECRRNVVDPRHWRLRWRSLRHHRVRRLSRTSVHFPPKQITIDDNLIVENCNSDYRKSYEQTNPRLNLVSFKTTIIEQFIRFVP
nr:Os06g0154550 [Ipomoea trifida]